MKCLETWTKDGVRHRRYRASDGHTFWTVEIPRVVFNGAMNMKSFDKRMASWNRAEQSRAKVATAEKRIAEGVKPLAIADELGLSTRYVQRLRKRMSAEQENTK